MTLWVIFDRSITAVQAAHVRCYPQATIGPQTGARRSGPKHSDVPSQALSAQLIALLLPCWLEGLLHGLCMHQ